MAKISELTETTSPASSDTVPIVQSGVTKKVQVSNLLNSSNVDINGGTIDGTVIGGTTRAAGSFTDLTLQESSSIVFNPGTTLTQSVTYNGGVVTETYAGVLNQNITSNYAIDVGDAFSVDIAGTCAILGGTTTITASTTHTLVGATGLTTYRNIVTTANADDTVRLPAAVAGLTIMVLNNTANTIGLYPASGDAIGAASADAKLDITTKTGVLLHAVDGTTWIKLSA